MTIYDGISALRAAKLAFERAGKKSLSLSCQEWLDEALEQAQSEERSAKSEARIRGIALRDGGVQ